MNLHLSLGKGAPLTDLGGCITVSQFLSRTSHLGNLQHPEFLPKTLESQQGQGS